MATIDLGRIKFKWQGAYNGATSYVIDDVVESGGSAYVCIAATTGNTPPNATYWELMASKGTDTSVLTTQGDVLYHDGTSLARLPAGTSGQYLETQGSGANPQWSTIQAGMTSGTAVNGSGSTITFTGIPSTAKLITVGVQQVQTSDNSPLGIQLGTSAGIVTSNYKGSGIYLHSGVNGTLYSSGFYTFSGSSTHVWNGVSIITYVNSTGSSNVWTATNNYYLSDSFRGDLGGGSIDLGSNVLDRIRIQTSTGGTITGGTININYI